MIFLCLGYMTGSDWRTYEDEYYYGFKHRLVEPGYMYLSESLSALGINFLVFEMTAKCLSFLCVICLLNLLIPKSAFYFGLALWYASYGLFLYVNCPFRNMIACGFVALGFIFLIKRKIVYYFVFVIVAISIHMSSIIMLIAPFLKFDKIGTKKLVITYIVVFIVMGIGGDVFLKQLIGDFMPEFLYERMDFYMETSTGSVFSIGTIPRILCLYLIMNYRSRITNLEYGNTIFNLAYFYLLVSLIYYVFPMLFRSSLYIGPFYVAGIAISSSVAKYNKKTIINVFFVIATTITFTTIRSYAYVPYTNIVYNCITNRFYDYNYRYNYNIRKSPYSTGDPNN